MSSKLIRSKNRFGTRYMTAKEFAGYAADLSLVPQEPSQELLEYMERVNLLHPIARVRFPAEIARRFAAVEEDGRAIILPVEGDTSRLEAANALRNELFFSDWYHPNIYGEREHLLDAARSEHAEFIQTEFDASSFIPWKEYHTAIWLNDDGSELFDGGRYSPIYYHYWQIFALASIFRSGVKMLYPLEKDDIRRALSKLNFSALPVSELYTTINLEARHELNKIIEHRPLFDAVAYFQAYRHNALRLYDDQVDSRTGRLATGAARAYRRREREIAEHVLAAFHITASDIVDFIGQQAEWWDWARRASPSAVAEEYARNIEVTMALYGKITGESFDRLSERVGRRGGWFRPILKVIFPDWLTEQRALTRRSLKSWADASLNNLPAPFPITESDIDAFCDWLEQAGLYQYYWHLHRFADFGIQDMPIYTAAAAAEAVAFANLAEMIANKVLEERGGTARGNTLKPKLKRLFDSTGPVDFTKLLERFWGLTRTGKSTLKRRLAQIDRIRQGGSHAPALRALLKLCVIRNEGSHLGLNSFDRVEILDMLETMAVASLIIWKAR